MLVRYYLLASILPGLPNNAIISVRIVLSAYIARDARRRSNIVTGGQWRLKDSRTAFRHGCLLANRLKIEDDVSAFQACTSGPQ